VKLYSGYTLWYLSLHSIFYDTLENHEAAVLTDVLCSVLSVMTMKQREAAPDYSRSLMTPLILLFMSAVRDGLSIPRDVAEAEMQWLFWRSLRPYKWLCVCKCLREILMVSDRREMQRNEREKRKKYHSYILLSCLERLISLWPEEEKWLESSLWKCV